MDGIPIPTSVTGGVAGALASHQVAREQLARKVHRRRLEEAVGATDADEAAPDGPVERAEGAEEVSSRLPDRQPPRAMLSPETKGQEHIDVVG